MAETSMSARDHGPKWSPPAGFNIPPDKIEMIGQQVSRLNAAKTREEATAIMEELMGEGYYTKGEAGYWPTAKDYLVAYHIERAYQTALGRFRIRGLERMRQEPA